MSRCSRCHLPSPGASRTLPRWPPCFCCHVCLGRSYGEVHRRIPHGPLAFGPSNRRRRCVSDRGDSAASASCGPGRLPEFHRTRISQDSLFKGLCVMRLDSGLSRNIPVYPWIINPRHKCSLQTKSFQLRRGRLGIESQQPFCSAPRDCQAAEAWLSTQNIPSRWLVYIALKLVTLSKSISLAIRNNKLACRVYLH